MENTHVISQTEGQGSEDSLYRLDAEREPFDADGLSSSESHSKQLVQRLNSIKDPYRQSSGSIDCSIPRHVVDLDEKYLRRFLELIHISASKATTCKISMNYSSGMVGILAGASNPAETKGESRFVFECPLGIVGSVMGSKSMTSLLESPLYCQFGSSASYGDVKLRRTNSEDDRGMICYNFMNSENHKFGSGSLDRRLDSMSSTKSTCSYQSSAGSACVSQGMIQCTWKGGSPHFVFSVDGEEEGYVANLSKVDSAEGKGLDYVYLLHSTKRSRKAHEIRDVESRLVGKIAVSTSFTIGPNSSKIKETEFVLYSNHMGAIQTSSHSLTKTKALTKKVVDVFRTKQTTMSKFSGYGSMWDEVGDVDLLEKHVPPNFELAAIVVKDSVPDKRQREAGGWGLKFLKNTGIIDSLGMMSMDILVPAGVHGGPRTRHGGPSSLIDRWRCGCCDCGGWDMGCPLTVFNTRPNTEATLHNTDNEGECNTCDLFIKGYEQSAPTLRMVNVGDGFYFINFQSTLSALQSFSIAVAFMHSREVAYVEDYK